ncbi:glycosyltransferase family 2 protein [bacterium]|nr:glycosyltransferase family 2 protein [candidate division CSSED10-310 bacterium]
MISIIIPSWNGRHLLEKSIPALVDQIDGKGKIIVVDNGSDDGTVEWLKSVWPEVRCLMLPSNKGFSGAVNEGITASESNDVILVNNDTEALPGWFDALRIAAGTHPDFHIFASRVLLADSREHIDTVGDGFTVAGFGYKHGWLEVDGPRYDQPSEVFAASGCAVYIRRNVFRTIGLFDEHFFAFGEDLDFCFRARLAGFRVMYIPDARILHAVRATSIPSNTLFWYHRNLQWTLMKNLPVALWLLYGPHILLHIGFVAVRSVSGRWFKVYVRSLSAALKGLPVMLARRKEIQAHRKVKLGDIMSFIDWNWPMIHWNLHQARLRYDRDKA